MHKTNIDKIFQETKKVLIAKEKIRQQLKNRKVNHDRYIIFPKILYPPSDVSIASQKWMFNGFVINYDDIKLCVDPAVDFLTRCSISGIDLTNINSVFLSHAHIDHYASFNIISEQISLGLGWHNATFLLPSNAIENKVVSDYHRGMWADSPPRVEVCINSKPIGLSGCTITPIEGVHSIDNSFGFVLNFKDLVIGYTGDTGYAEEIVEGQESYKIADIKTPIYNDKVRIVKKRMDLKKAYSQTDVLIVNLNSMEYNKHSKTHLSGFDLIDIVKGSSVKQIIIAHLNTRPGIETSLNSDIAQYIECETGIRTVALTNDVLKIEL